MNDEEEAPIIYGLDFQARCISAQLAETEIQRFLVGTQSLKYLNQIHLVEYNDDLNSLSKCIYEHREGEIWHIASSPSNKLQFLTCYNKLNSITNVSMKCSIWELPEEIEMSIAADNSTCYNLKHLCELPVETSIVAIWQPDSTGSQIISLSENCISYLDLADSKPKLISTANLEAKGQPKFTNCKWNVHHNYSQIATCNDSAIRGWDLRSMKQCYTIENAHTQLVRDIDFNPNKQYYLASCGDDCKTKIWDTRKTDECLKTLSNHSHWVWSVHYNTFHDQLILTSSSDNRVVLSSIPSLSSEPYKTLIDDESLSSSTNTQNKTNETVKETEPDRVVKVYEDHEDSVYATEWSAVDPWVFASLSYDGRLVISKVPKDEKYKILL